MFEKKVGALFLVSSILVLSLGLASAGFFSDLFGITGNVVYGADTCQGTDATDEYPDGKNYYEMGWSTYNGNLRADNCTGDILTERYCDGSRKRIEYDCSSEGLSCAKGACVAFDTGEPEPLGCELKEDEFVLIEVGNEGSIYEVIQIYNNTGTDYTKDVVKIEEWSSKEVYEATFYQEGKGSIYIDGNKYDITFKGSSGHDSESMNIGYAGDKDITITCGVDEPDFEEEDNETESKRKSDFYGDLNYDGYVTATDAFIVQRHVDEIEFIYDSLFDRADVDGDFRITENDYMSILEYAVYKLEFFPIEAREVSFDSCSDSTDFLKDPYSFKIKDDPSSSDWVLRHSWDKEWGYYGARFDLRRYHEFRYDSLEISVQEFEDNSWTNATDQLDRLVEYNLCSKEPVGGELVYVCIDLWEVRDSFVDLDSDKQFKNKNIYWVSDSKLFELHFYSPKDFWSCYDQESCDRKREYEHQRSQENLVESLETLLDNRPQYIGGFYIDWTIEAVLGEFLDACNSDISEEDSGCSSSYRCNLEPVVCPPHGYQTQRCVQWCEGEEQNVKEQEISCTPGICSGCYVPRWFDYKGDNTCIPYGTRFEQQTGWSISEEFVEEESSGKLYVGDVEGDEELVLEVYPDNSALLTIATYPAGTFRNMTLEEGKTYDLSDFSDFGDTGLSLEITVEEIYYDSTNYEDSYVTIFVYISGFEERKSPETFNAYCNYDGRILQQKLKDKSGDWASCQNNYECESNLCSSGECVDIAEGIRQIGVFRGTFIRLTCRLANIFNGDGYESCMANAGLEVA